MGRFKRDDSLDGGRVGSSVADIQEELKKERLT